LTRVVCGNSEIKLFADDALIYTSQEVNDNLNIQMQKEMVEK